jgi:hypothetical protein
MEEVDPGLFHVCFGPVCLGGFVEALLRIIDMSRARRPQLTVRAVGRDCFSIARRAEVTCRTSRQMNKP